MSQEYLPLLEETETKLAELLELAAAAVTTVGSIEADRVAACKELSERFDARLRDIHANLTAAIRNCPTERHYNQTCYAQLREFQISSQQLELVLGHCEDVRDLLAQTGDSPVDISPD